MTVLPSQICLSSSRSTPKCCKFVHHVGERENESILQKGLNFSPNPSCKVSPKQAILGSHCLHCTPFSENAFPHNLSSKFILGSHFLNYKYPNIRIHHTNLSSQDITFMLWKSYHCIENWKFSMNGVQ